MSEENKHISVLGLFFNMLSAFLGVYAAAGAVTYFGLDTASYLMDPPYWGWWLESAIYGLFVFWFYGFDYRPIRTLLRWPSGKRNKQILQWVLGSALLFLLTSALRHVLGLKSVMFTPPDGGTGFIAVTFELLALAAIAPLGEELIFRGYLQEKLVPLKGPKKAILITSIIFGLLHVSLVRMILVRLYAMFSPSEYGGMFMSLLSEPIEIGIQRMLYTGVSGVLFGYFAWYYKSLWPAIIAHAIYNAMAVLHVDFGTLNRLLVDYAGMQETALFPYIVMAVCSAGLFGMIKKYDTQ
jgi:membrane protease YdiL (CAAX protease family)